MGSKTIVSTNSTPKLEGASSSRFEDLETNGEALELSQNAQRFLDDQKIRDQLCNAVCNQDYIADRFITLVSLRVIWTDQLLKEFMAILGHTGGESSVKTMREDLIKTLSILVHMKWDKWSKFESMFFPGGWEQPAYEHRTDKNIPYPYDTLKEQSFLGSAGSATDFSDHQIKYMPKVIVQGETEFVPRWQPLPFIKSEQKRLGTGGFGFVTREIIAQGQFSGPRPRDGKYSLFGQDFEVARKRFQIPRDFRKEANNLAKLASILSSHQRLVKHHAFITTGDEADAGGSREFNILLPLADTDLRQLLYEQRFSSHCVDLVHLLEEARNVLDALRFLHQNHVIAGDLQTFCHMDLKLDNILVFELGEGNFPAGCWKISDFGISSTTGRSPTELLRSASQRTQRSSLPVLAGNTASISVQREAGTYSAPEVHRGSKVGTASDVWSFGCILFQILVRGTGGLPKLLEMDDKRVTSTHDHFWQEEPIPQLHPEVQKWLDSQKFVGHSMDQEIVRNCKKLIRHALQVDSKKRATAMELLQGLTEICKQNRDTAESVAGSPTRSAGASSGHTSKLEPSISPRPPPLVPVNNIQSQYPTDHVYENPRQSRPPHAAPATRVVKHQSPPPDPSNMWLTIDFSPDYQPGGKFYEPGSRSKMKGGLVPKVKSFFERISESSFMMGPTLPGAMSASDYRRLKQDKNAKIRALSLPALSDATTSSEQSNRRSQRFSTATQRPQAFTMTGALPGSSLQDTKPYAESTTSSDKDSMAAQKQARAMSTNLIENLQESSVSSDATSGPRGEPVPKDYWEDVTKSKQIARARSSRSSVPSVNVGHAKTHNFLNISQHTIMTLISSTAAKVAFISPKGVDIATLYDHDPECKNYIRAANGINWERGTLAGNYLALQGYSNLNQKYPLHLYQLRARSNLNQPCDPQLLDYKELELPRLPLFEKFDISRDGRLLLGSPSTIYLGDIDDEPYELEPTLKTNFNLRRVWFSTSGLIAFAWSSGPKNRHRINWWEVENYKQRLGRLTHQIVNNQATADRIRVIHFPKSPLCLLWQDHEFYLLQEAEKPDVLQLQECPIVDPVAVVVTPNEDAVVFIRYSGGFKKRVSKILICPIRKSGDYLYIDYDFDKNTGQSTLQNHIKEPDKCEVVIEEHEGSNRDIKVLIAQRNGSFEVKNMQIPA